MSTDSRDAAYLYDILVAAKDVAEFVSGLTFGDFEKDKKCRYAVESQLLVAGEAANHLSEEITAKTRRSHGPPWLACETSLPTTTERY